MILDNLTADRKMDVKVENKSIEASAIPGTDGLIKCPKISESYNLDELVCSPVKVTSNPMLKINSFENGNNSNDPGEFTVKSGRNESCDVNKPKIPCEISPICVKSYRENSVQRHLYTDFKSHGRKQHRESPILRGNLSKKLKQHKTTLNPETPDKASKSEIFRMFEKIRYKREEKMSQELQDIGLTGDLINENLKIKKMPADSALKASKSPTKLNDIIGGKLVTNSPKLKPKNRSKFEELRSIFESRESSNPHEKNGKGIPKKQVFNENINALNKNSNNISNIESIDVRNINLRPDKISPSSTKIASKKSTFMRVELSGVQNIESVVRRPDHRNIESPKLDFKQKNPSSSKKLRGKSKKLDELSSLTPITRFFEKKIQKKHEKLYGESSARNDEKETFEVGKSDYEQ